MEQVERIVVNHCQSKCGKSPTVSCSSTGFFSADKCLKNGSAVSDPDNDPDCKDLKDDNGDDCQYNVFIKHWILYLVLIIIILFGIGIFIYALS